MKCRRVEILAAVVLFVSVSPVMAVIEFKDGLTHDIDYLINDDVSVDYESPGLGTTLNILDGATMSYPCYLEGWEDSIINMSGGSMNYLFAFNSSQVTVSGGSIGDYRGGLYAYDISQVAVSGGSMNDLFTAGSSQVAVSGGSIITLFAGDSSRVTVSGGSVHWLDAFDSSQVAVSGGSIGILAAHQSSQVTVSGGSIGGRLLVRHTAVLTIHGWDFAVDGMPVGYTELYSIFGGWYMDEPVRQLTGTLLSGDPINNGFRIGNNGKIVLVPEPATLLLLGLGAVILRKRRA